MLRKAYFQFSNDYQGYQYTSLMVANDKFDAAYTPNRTYAQFFCFDVTYNKRRPNLAEVPLV